MSTSEHSSADVLARKEALAASFSEDSRLLLKHLETAEMEYVSRLLELFTPQVVAQVRTSGQVHVYGTGDSERFWDAESDSRRIEQNRRLTGRSTRPGSDIV